MDLQKSLKIFRKQEERIQSMRLITAPPQTTPSKFQQLQKAAVASTLTPVKAAVKFSNDIEWLQHVNAIRKSPVGSQIKRVIDLLLETRLSLTAEQINEACYVDINRNKIIFDSLKNNHKVHFHGERFSYKSKHKLKGKDPLLSLIRENPDGVTVEDIKDSYPSVMEDLQALKAAGQVWLVPNMDSKEELVYPIDPKVMIQVDDDLKQLFRSIELPRDMIDIEKELRKNGMKPVTNTADRRNMAQMHGITSKPKSKNKLRMSKRTRITNAHMPELFKMNIRGF